MNDKLNKVLYFGSTGLFTALIGMGVVMYFAQHTMVAEMFESLGYPPYLIYPLAFAKTAGLITIWARRKSTLAGMAYAGFTFNLTLAVGAHIAAADGEFAAPLVALALLATSYFTGKRVALGEENALPRGAQAASV